MRAAVLHGPDDLRIEEVPDPSPGPGELVIAVEVALTCATDAKMLRAGRHPALGPLPAPFGHECVGHVVARGSGRDGPAIGERVVPANSAPCDECRSCRRGRPGSCLDPLYLTGAFAPLLRVPARIARRNLLRPPDDLAPELAAMAEPLACAVRALERADAREADTVLVLGGGPQGLFLTWLAARRGCRVILCDPHSERRERARRFGATAVAPPPTGAAARDEILSLTDGAVGADVVFAAVGDPAAWEQAIDLVVPGGEVNLHGGCPPGATVTLDAGRLHYDEVRVRGSYHHSPSSLRVAVDHLAAGLIPVGDLLGPPITLDQLGATLAAGGDKRPVDVVSRRPRP